MEPADQRRPALFSHLNQTADTCPVLWPRAMKSYLFIYSPSIQLHKIHLSCKVNFTLFSTNKTFQLALSRILKKGINQTVTSKITNPKDYSVVIWTFNISICCPACSSISTSIWNKGTINWEFLPFVLHENHWGMSQQRILVFSTELVQEMILTDCTLIRQKSKMIMDLFLLWPPAEGR